MATGERPPSSRERPLGVAEVVRLAGRVLDGLGLVWLEGEVTQATQPASGHLYFALRDRESVLSAVMWGRDAARMRFRIEPGQRLRVRGRLGVYDRDGKMQLYADFAEPAGFGAEALALEQLKAKLAAEGIFAAERKRPLPRFPRRIGVVTSKSGAAIHDIIRTVQRRMPTPILIADAAVQGANAPNQIVMGLAMVVRAGVDVVIVGRGGGAATDLTAFNHERVVRTIARCPVPVISAVGHESDLSLADLAADARASTPTAAAELAVPDAAALADQLAKERRRLDRELRHRLDRGRQDLDHQVMALHARGERALGGSRAELHALAHRLTGLHPRKRLFARGTLLAELARRLTAVHPASRLRDGGARGAGRRGDPGRDRARRVAGPPRRPPADPARARRARGDRRGDRMSARPPRATTKGEPRRARTRGATHGERADRADKRRAASVIPTDRFERIADDQVVEVTELPEVPQLRMMVLESASHLASAQGAIAASGHQVLIGAAGRDAIERLRAAIGDVDAVLVPLPGGEPLIDAALALGARRPVVIAASTASATEAVRRAAAAGADLATVRPHDVERLAPILLAAARLVEHRRPRAEPDGDALRDVLDDLSDPEPGGLVAAAEFEVAAQRELERAERFGYPLSVAMFSVDFAAPPPALRGILRARAGNALIHALRDIDLATELDPERFLVLMPHTERVAGGEIARRILGAVSAGDPVIAGGRTFAPKVIGAVTGPAPGEPAVLERLIQDVAQLLEQAEVTGASLAVET